MWSKHHTYPVPDHELKRSPQQDAEPVEFRGRVETSHWAFLNIAMAVSVTCNATNQLLIAPSIIISFISVNIWEWLVSWHLSTWRVAKSRLKWWFRARSNIPEDRSGVGGGGATAPFHPVVIDFRVKVSSMQVSFSGFCRICSYKLNCYILWAVFKATNTAIMFIYKHSAERWLLGSLNNHICVAEFHKTTFWNPYRLYNLGFNTLKVKTSMITTRSKDIINKYNIYLHM